ncbi:MAG TPA: NAD+ synthase [Ignavibacteriaceae bacterium]|nr:NAD+ synthase [Ignavibacteriaceae bacterium]
MKIALCQTNPLIGDLRGNSEEILRLYNRSVDAGADLVVFPELSLIGYSPLDLIEKKEFRKAVQSAAESIASKTGSAGLIFGSITEVEDNVGTNLFNSALLCFDGKIQFVQNKTLIPNYDIFDEIRYFESAKDVFTFNFKDEVLGISICEDIWNDKDYWIKRLYENDPVEKLIHKGATLLINLSASPYSFGKRLARKEMLSTLTNKDNVKLAYCCCYGAQTEVIFDGASMCFDNKGNLVKLGAFFKEDCIFFDTKESYPAIGNIERSFEEEIIDALTLGIKDYCEKLKFENVILGLSGGIDSAIVTYLAVKALGPDRVTAVLLPSEYSSEGSITDSLKLITSLGIKHELISIQPVFEEFLESLEPVFRDVPLDITEENLQSRSRGVILMALSNKFRSLLLTTGNKSEIAVGYATLYGDMCGALAVIGDLYKTEVYRIANYVNRSGEVIPYNIISKPPSAELRHNQTDQDSLPPYDILDNILRMYLEENKEFNEISDITKLPEITRKVLALVDNNEFKRRQAAPALRVSKKAFGYGRRYPVVQGWRKLNN